MKDKYPNWRNHRWSVDAEICNVEDVPILRALIAKEGKVFDDKYIYHFQGKGCYIIRFPHYGGMRNNYRLPTERYKPKLPEGQTILHKKKNRELKE